MTATGLNGSGKSTLLRIMAGVDKDIKGEVLLSKGYTVGMLEQEPELDKAKTVRGVEEEGVRETVQLLKDFGDVSDKLGDPNLTPENMEKLLDKQGKLQERIDAAGASPSAGCSCRSPAPDFTQDAPTDLYARAATLPAPAPAVSPERCEGFWSEGRKWICVEPGD